MENTLFIKRNRSCKCAQNYSLSFFPGYEKTRNFIMFLLYLFEDDVNNFNCKHCNIKYEIVGGNWQILVEIRDRDHLYFSSECQRKKYCLLTNTHAYTQISILILCSDHAT